MIEEYYRPKTVMESEQLFKKKKKKCVPLGGGSALSRSKQKELCVVDLRELGLNRIETVGHKVNIGATVTLQEMLESEVVPAIIRGVIQKSATLNLRNQATVGGYIASADGRSPLAIVLMAMDAVLIWHPDQKAQAIGDWFALRQPSGFWISAVQLNSKLLVDYEQIARTPMDQPIVAISVARWPSGRIRIAAGGFGKKPVLVLDGPEDSGILEAVRNALNDSGDEWASAEYRQAVGEVMVRRIMEKTT